VEASFLLVLIEGFEIVVGPSLILIPRAPSIPPSRGGSKRHPCVVGNRS
jgi:hypothetical protein